MPFTARSLRRSVLVLGVSLPTMVSAQSVAIFGSVEAAGYGEGSAFLGTSISASGLGWKPYVGIGAYTFRYRSSTGHNNESAIAPSIGLVHNGPQQSVQFGVGYVFLTENAPAQTSSGAPLGSQDSPFVSAQYSYWGDGSKDVLLLGSYATKSRYVWTRGSALTRVGGPTGKLFAGGEVGLQGSGGTDAFPLSSWRIQAGPAIGYRINETFRVGAAAGVRIAAGDAAPPMTGYLRLDFLALPKF